jgi:hypothetical protein
MVEARSKQVITEEHKAKIGLALKELWEMPEYRDKLMAIHNSPETRARMSLAQIGKILTEEHKSKIGRASKELWGNPEFREKAIKNHIGFKHSEESKRRMSESVLGHEVSDETREKLRLANLGKTLTEEHKEKTRQSMLGKKVSEETKAKHREWWENPENKERAIRAWIKASHIRPNIPETKIGNILNGLYPNEWKYTGDGSFIIGGLLPDFLCINGDKKVIELFGDYYHSGKRIGNWNRTEQGRIETFSKFGFSCLVIWESELSNSDNVMAKIREFCDK